MRIANLQYTALANEAETLATVMPMLEVAKAEGADLVALPECANCITSSAALLESAETPSTSRSLASFCEAAARHEYWLLVGSLLLRSEQDAKKLINRSFLLSPEGNIHAQYDKIHMFDVDINDGQHYRESDHYNAGDKAVLARTPLAAIGMTICYDLRFPALHHALAKAGAEILAVPAAFTETTGAAHWHSLLRARAIETGCFVIAPAQTGTHADGRRTWGHALIINPWGEILADAGQSAGVSVADINLAEVAEMRGKIPAISRTQPFTLEVLGG